MTRHYATVDDILATYSSHISENHPSPEVHRKDLERILAKKRERNSDAEYIASLETNIIFLHDIITEGEALLDVIFDTKKSNSFDSGYVNDLLIDMEERVRAWSEERRTEIFITGSDEEFSELYELKSGGGSAYREKLEETYRYLMTFKIFIFELFNILGSILQDHPIARTTPENRSRIMNHIELTVNYYLGNIKVDDTREP